LERSGTKMRPRKTFARLFYLGWVAGSKVVGPFGPSIPKLLQKLLQKLLLGLLSYQLQLEQKLRRSV
jgi:hypothetical protein